MKISGLIKSSMIDFPGKIAAVVFVQGCNFRCGFCHNPDLVDIRDKGVLSEEEVITFLERRKNILEGVVITGGEPTIDIGLEDFIIKIKKLGYAVKLDSNGSNPKTLKRLIDGDFLDYVAMDIKGPLEKYSEICGYKDVEKIKESIQILLDSKLNYEFRTTVLPKFHKLSDFGKIGKLITGAKLYTIQGFRPQITLDKTLQKETPFTKNELEEIKNEVFPFVQNCRILDNY